MKGCLKQLSPLPSPALPDCLHSRKCVAFEADGSEQVFFVDEWDRTPTEPTRKLSYQDLMELKEIQCSLPLANQPPDPITGRPGRHYLSNVPIALLPLLPSSDTQNETTGTMHGQGLHGSSSRATPHRNIIAGANKPRPAPSNHLPTPAPRTTNNFNGSYPQISNPFARRPKTNFAFLPLLDTPPPSAESSLSSSQSNTPSPSNPSSRSTSPDLPSDTDHTDPPTPSLTNASLDSPVSCASSLVSWSPEPTFLQLPPKHLSCLDHGNGVSNGLHFGPIDSYFPAQTEDSDVNIGDCMPSYRHSRHSTPVRRSSGVSEKSKTPPSNRQSQKKNVIIVNGTVIDLDADEEVQSTPAPPPPVKQKNIIIVNGVEIDLDGDENGVEMSTPAQPSDTAPSIHCNSTENLKPPESKSGNEIKTGFSSPYSLSSPISSVSPLPASTISSRTTLNADTPRTRPNLGSTKFNMASSTGLGLELDSGAVSDARPGIGSKSNIIGSTTRPSIVPSMETNTGSSTGSSLSNTTLTFSTVTECPRPGATDFGSLHIPLRFKRNSATKMVSTDSVVSS